MALRRRDPPIDIRALVITTKRLRLVPIARDFTADIIRHFTPEITRYMLPAPPR